jgi:[glutamine synthetase] adenylyltransferase / [glutamine synthetase]-adenylyl-L-tyrosine phosphorylase
VQSRRPETLTTHLIRAGFADLTRSASLWQDPDLVAVLDSRPKGSGGAGPAGPDGGSVELEPADAALLRSLAAVADPDLTLLQLVRLAAVAPDRLRPILAVPDGGSAESQDDVDTPRPTARDRLLRVLGSSSALGDELVRHPSLLDVIRDRTPGTGVPAEVVRAELLRAVDADPDADEPVAGTHAPAGGTERAGDAPPSYTDRLRRA